MPQEKPKPYGVQTWYFSPDGKQTKRFKRGEQPEDWVLSDPNAKEEKPKEEAPEKEEAPKKEEKKDKKGKE